MGECSPKGYATSHDLILRQPPCGLCTLHSLAGTLVHVSDVAQNERATAILVSSELGYGMLDCAADKMGMLGWQLTDRRLSVGLLFELDNTSSTGATVRLVLDLGTFDLPDCGEELDKIFIASGPRKLK
jgi:hypothetical protein